MREVKPIIAAVSGGLDSTAMLWRLLTETDDLIHVFHVSLRNVQWPRFAFEDAATDYILKRMLEVRPFTYSNKVLEKAKGWDIVIVSKAAAKMAIENGIEPKALARGTNAHDASRERLNRARDAANLVWGQYFPNAPVIYPIVNMTRHQMLEMLPEDIVERTWSCRRPSDESFSGPCGICSTCREFKELGLSLGGVRMGRAQPVDMVEHNA